MQMNSYLSVFILAPLDPGGIVIAGGRSIEARSAEGGVFGVEHPAPSHQIGDLGEHCKLPHRVLGGAPAEIKFSAF